MSNTQSEIVPAEQKLAGLRRLLMSEKVQRQILTALPRNINGERMFRVYLTAVQKTPKILDCDPVSVIGAVMQAAQLGLSLDSVFGEGFLIPRWNKNTRGQVLQFQIGYKGLRRLGLKADDTMRDIYARVVYANDLFEFAYEPKTLRHTPADSTARGDIKFAYAKVIWKDGYDRFVVVGKPEIDKAKASSDSFKAGYGPWIDHEDAMWSKTALRRLCDTLTLNSESDLAKGMVAEDGDGRQALTAADLDMVIPVVDANGGNGHSGGSALDQLAGQGAQQPQQPAQPKQRRQRTVQTTGAPAAQQAARGPDGQAGLPGVGEQQADQPDRDPGAEG
jgi:recombination protein RecT